jgi:hypothetical protein
MMFNIYMWIYIIAAVFAVAGVTYKLYGFGYMYGAIIFCIAAIIISIMFGIKWFGASNSILSNAPVSWPPFINTCPDYLTYYERQLPNGTKQKTCIDQIGVSTNGVLKVFPNDGIAPSANEYYFDLTVSSTDPANKNKVLCANAMAAGLTWEGITNGESCAAVGGTDPGSAPAASCKQS